MPPFTAAARTVTAGTAAARTATRTTALRAAALAVLIATAGVTVLAPAAAAAEMPPPGARVVLPSPTGPYPVGTVSLHLVDSARTDPWTGEGPRELMATVRYPARDTAHRPAAPQMTAAAAAVFETMYRNGGDLPMDRVAWAQTLTHAHEDAPADLRGGPRPVVLYSPGAGDPAAFGTTLADDLASRGYVVVSFDHTYEAPAVEFPRGRVAASRMDAEIAAIQDPDPEKARAKLTALLRKLVDVRVSDTRFVLDQVGALAAGRNPDAEHRRLPQGLGAALVPGRIGMFGQSAGGFTALQTMHDDPRIKAGENLDGVLGYVGDDHDPANPATVSTDGLDRPFLLMGSEGDDHHRNPSWGGLWGHSIGWHRDLTLTGSAHASYTDMESMLPQIARQLDLPPGTVTATIGAVVPERAVAAERACTAAFFDRTLRHRDNHLLDRASDRLPDIRFVD
ncbi:platelet-activating factor acetylhydrolase isoform II [Streptomyces sp. TLI_235]|nr:hydrolase [Streptomyces sp. TLI_235]PBC70641.1 platelet-activating factor acetylhydrolase isoform II [Streptomyces sp. TLI_235]